MGTPSRRSQFTPVPKPVNGQKSPPGAPPKQSPRGGSNDQPNGSGKRLRTRDIAKRVGRSQRTIRLWCDIGHLPAYKLGLREWSVDEEAFNTWFEKRKKSED